MPRTIAAAFVSTFLFAAAAAAQEELVVPGADPAPAAAEPGPAEPEAGAEPSEPSEGEEFFENEAEYEEGEMEFCGGGDEEETPVQLASYELEASHFARARRMIVEALRTGQVAEWERPYALSVLAEAQLRLRQYRQAVVNYRKSLRIDPDSAPASRVGLATALYLSGQRAAAHEEAITARDALCSDQWSYAACFGAHAVLANTESDASAREAAVRAMQTIRAAHPEATEQLDSTERRLERARRRARAPRGEERS